MGANWEISFFIRTFANVKRNILASDMENDKKYISVCYKLYCQKGDEEKELVETATADRPFQFVSGMGMTLDDFESQMLTLQKGEKFDFTLTPEQAYGAYVPEAVQELPRDIFLIDGKLDKDYVFEGAVVPLQNQEGDQFNGTITKITSETVTVDLNHPLAGQSLNFVGEMLENRPATDSEVQQTINQLAGECSGGCGGCGGGCGKGNCGGGCGECGGC